MILNITAVQFPDRILGDIKYSQNIYKSIDFNFGKDANSAINKESLDTFVHKFKEIHRTHEKPLEGIITLGTMKNLSLDTLKVLLSSEDFVRMLDPQSFLKLIVTSSEIADFVLSNPMLKAKLDDMEPQIDKQKFKNSCTARLIMRILLERGIIDQHDYSPSKELEIYKQIWFAPGKEASPEKIVSFFQRHNLHAVGVEIKELSKASLKKYSRDPVIASLYSLFKKEVPARKKLTLTHLSEADFPEGMTTLIVIHTGVLHTLLGKKTQEHFEVTDPQFGDKKTYNGFMDFLENERKNIGIFFDILPEPEEHFGLKS
ncbi:dehydrogenase [Fluoribacter dumoffii]|uniref:dehydrogenase n=1 Tax=Fluoribacter dumoffii TaxID=463 RepID=UPI002244A09C|nr:dehydrogenase [Fluoribacter dumoffii]MCW8419422.1 dehydrogenase [Fluoribacter dumoffii]MCW8452703.1 dehydrogenase [Fluoribacter dumoffii]MCW8460047.1 dehydrogenase [Fluoribacter dumoffii]MCW8483525.1 dehydrogenase [Fluoribacter dumoffii]